MAALSALGLVGLLAGGILANVFPTPVKSQIGTILAGIGVVLLVLVAVGNLVF